MALYLVQHGKSLPKEVDPEKGLSDEGIADVERIAKTARAYDIRVSAIRHSGKKRARQTAEYIGRALSVSEIAQIAGMNPLDDVTDLAKTLSPAADLMLVGHLPFMERLVSWLTTGSTEFTVFKFQNGGIVCVDRLPDSDRWAVKWALMPNIS